MHRDELGLADPTGVTNNGRCSHIARIFRPDIVRSGRAGIPLIASGQYFESEEYVRIVEPNLASLNQIMLQACIQRELGELSASQYTQIYRENSSKFVALSQGFSAAPTSEEIARTHNASSSITLTPGDIERLAKEIADRTTDASSPIGVNLEALRTDIKRDAASLNDITQRSSTSWNTRTETFYRTVPAVLEKLTGIYIVFDTAEAELSEQSRTRLDVFLQETCCNRTYQVYGFANIQGEENYNLALSRIRAVRTSQYLRSRNRNISVNEIALGESRAFGKDLSDNRIVYIVATANE